jgi:hypothetical protein
VPGIAEQGLPGVGRQHIAVAAHQAVADHVFQAAHLLADGRLGRMQARGSGGEAAAVGHHDNGAQQVEVEQSLFDFTLMDI